MLPDVATPAVGRTSPDKKYEPTSASLSLRSSNTYRSEAESDLESLPPPLRHHQDRGRRQCDTSMTSAEYEETT